MQGLLDRQNSQGDDAWMHQPNPDGLVTTYTWGHAADQARRIAQYLVSLNLPAASNIILIGKNSAEWIVADFAIWMAGHVSVPIYPTIGKDNFDYIVEHCDAQALVVGRMDIDLASAADRELLASMQACPHKICLAGAPELQGVLSSDICAEYEPIEHVDLRDPEALATIVYTSGTTGRPKGVMHCFRSLTAPSCVSEQLWNISAQDRMLSYLPLAHIAERVSVEIPSIRFGFQVFFNESLETFAQDLQRAQPTLFFSVPRLWMKFYQAVNAALPRWKQRILFNTPFLSKRVKGKILNQLGLGETRIGLTGAAPLSKEIVAWYQALGLEMLEVFGMTENAATSHATQRGNHDPGTVGIPVPGVECKLSASGEVLVKSPGQMLGYYRQAELTNEHLTADGFFHTGDLGEIDADNRLRITGRVNDLFKTSKGKFVAPVPIENQLSVIEGVEAVCVMGRGAAQPYGLLTLTEEFRAGLADQHDFSAELSSFLTQLNRNLEAHERLQFIVVCTDEWTVESGLVTPTLKVKRAKVEEAYSDHVEAWQQQGQPVVWQA